MTDKEREKIKKELKVDLNLTYFEFAALVAMVRSMVEASGAHKHETASDQFALDTLLNLHKKVEDKLDLVAKEVDGE